MSIERFTEKLSSLVRSGAISTNQARVLSSAVTAAEVTDEETLTHIVQAIATDRLSVDELNVILERAPRFADALQAGLRPLFGEVSTKRLQELARHGNLTASVLERALG